MRSKLRPRQTRLRFRTNWGELEYVCVRIHTLLYVKKNEHSARRVYLSRLGRILEKLPENDMAIIREEGLALLYELKGDRSNAIKHRKREIQLMEKLHEDVEAEGYDEKMKASILLRRDKRALQERRAIVQALKNEENCSAK